MEAGTYLMKCIGHEIGKSSQKGTQQLGILLEVTQGDKKGQRISGFLYFSELTYKRSIESLRTLGWKGGDIQKGEGLGTTEAEVVVEMEVHNGQKRARIKWINRPGEGGFGMKAVGADEASMFASRIADLAATVPETASGAPVGTQEPLPIGANPNDADDPLPF